MAPAATMTIPHTVLRGWSYLDDQQVPLFKWQLPTLLLFGLSQGAVGLVSLEILGSPGTTPGLWYYTEL